MMALTHAEAQYINRHSARVKDLGGGKVTFEWEKNADGVVVITKVLAELPTKGLYETRPQEGMVSASKKID